MTGAGLVHQTFLYDGAGQLAEAMAPVVRDAARRGDEVLVAAKRESLEALRAELGDERAGIELHNTREWHPRPVHRLTALQRALAGLRPGASLLALAEPVWSGSEAERREWARCESTINVALADAPLRFICLHDRSELPDRIVEQGLAAYPEVVDGAAVCACAAFAPPEQLVRRLDADGAVAAPAAEQRHEIAFRGDHHGLRDSLAGLALECGVGADRTEELVLAANEVVTNAVIHGEPPIAARCWVADGDFVCEISDGGAGVEDPFAGWTLPAAGAPGGWGLALARRVCDALEVSGDGRGSRVRLYVGLGPRAAGAA